MTPATCGIMPCNNGEFWQRARGKSESRLDDSCILSDNHLSSEHMFQLPDGRYIFWETDWDCGCPEPECTDCFTYAILSVREGEQLLEAVQKNEKDGQT